MPGRNSGILPAIHPQGVPNIVVVLMDDARSDDFDMGLPWTRDNLKSSCKIFTNAHGEVSLCAPTRASLLTGRHSFDTNVWDVNTHANSLAYSEFQNDEANSLGPWMQAAGYNTFFSGKVLNGYEDTSTRVPVGWDTFKGYASVGYAQGDWTYRDNAGTTHSSGGESLGYSTDWMSTQAVSFINNAPSSKPIFMYLCPYAPHEDAGGTAPTPPTRYTSTPYAGDTYYHDYFANTEARPSNWNVVNAGQHPYLQAMSAVGGTFIDNRYLARLRSMVAVDDMNSAIYTALQNTGRLANTLIVFMSDNGMCMGAHKLPDKRAAYGDSTRVPLWVYYPRENWHGNYTGLADISTDVTKMILDVAGISAAGKTATSAESLADMCRGGPGHRWMPIMNHADDNNGSDPIQNGDGNAPTYCGIRTPDELYLSYKAYSIRSWPASDEYYQLGTDPGEVSPVNDTAAKARLKEQAIEICGSGPPGWTWP